MDEDLGAVYFDPAHPASYGDAEDLYKSVKHLGYTLNQVKDWLNKQDVYTLHKKVNRQLQRPRVVVSEVDQQWDGDTVNFVKYKKQNKGYAYLLVLIDIMSRFAITVPLLSLKGDEMEKTLRKVFKHHKPKSIRFDKGSEFQNKWVQKYLSSKKIHCFFTTQTPKANYAERLILTLKRRITRYMHKNDTERWIDIIANVTKAYNLSRHSTIKMSPVEARSADKFTLWMKQYGAKNPRPRKHPSKWKPLYKFNIDDKVRLARFKSTFERAYAEKWTNEIFIVANRYAQEGIALYTIKTFSNKPVKGNFYELELQKVQTDTKTEFIIEKTVKRKTINGQKGFIVKWEGYPSSENSFVPATDIIHLKHASRISNN